MDKKKVLGRGLDTLIPAARSVAAPAAAVVSGEAVQQIPLDEIERNPYQTRGQADEAALEELAASIRSTGVLQPIVIRYKPAGTAALGYPGSSSNNEDAFAAGGGARGSGDSGGANGSPGEGAGAYPIQKKSGAGSQESAESGNGHSRPGAAGVHPFNVQAGVPVPARLCKYQLIAGERRWLASRLAGKTTIPAIVRQVSNEQAMEMTIIENLQREDLNAMDQARAFHRLSQEFGLTQEQMATRTGKDRASIGNYLRLLKLPEEVQLFVENGGLTMGHAKALLAIEDPERMKHYAYRTVNAGWSVRMTEYEVQKHLYPEKHERRKLPKHVDPNVTEAERELQRSLGLKVHINDYAGKGSVVIHYDSVEDFDRILEAFGK